ncbi:hypothetical protein NCC49_003014 [Naganishia albida]|nr:hypothetical protein NCC49_003014 [Naganishia albida]
MPEGPLNTARETGGPQQPPSTATQSRYLTRSATRKGTSNLSHLLAPRLPSNGLPTRTTRSSTPAAITTETKTRKPFIEALNRVASSSENTQPAETLPAIVKNIHNVDPFKAPTSPARTLPANRKRQSSKIAASPRGLGNSPNMRPRKVARMPRISGIGLSPARPIFSRPLIRTHVMDSEVAKVGPTQSRAEVRSPPDEHSRPSVTTSTTTKPEPSSPAKPPSPAKILSPAKVPVGSATPFRYGTNRILDVPLSAVKKGARWSLASDLSDDSLLLQASPKKPAQPLKSFTNSPIREGEKNGTRQKPEDIGKGKTGDFDLSFFGEESKNEMETGNSDDGLRAEKEDEVGRLIRPLSKVSLARHRMPIPQKTSTARIVQRAQKSLSLPRTTSSYAKPTQSSAKAASVTAAAIDARTSLKNAIREPIRKPMSTPATQISTSAATPTTFARPCGVQSRTSAVPSSSTSAPVKSAGSTGYSILTRDPTKRSPLKPCQPPSPVRQADPNVDKTKGVTSGTLSSNARRKSLTMETSKSLFNLSAALAKLTVKRPSLEGKSPDAESSSIATQQDTIRPSDQAQTANREASVAKPIAISRISKSTSIHGRSSLGGQSFTNTPGDIPGRSISSSLKGLTRDAPGTSSQSILKGVIAFVDVRTAEGDDTSAVFADILRACGGRVLSKPSESCTHIIFKSGKVSTLVWWRKQSAPKPHIVGIGWLTRSRDSGQRQPEAEYAVDVAAQAVFQKRRKSMEPRQLHALMGTSIESLEPSSLSTSDTNMTHARRQTMHFGQS